jgi:hypothetical protein
VVMRTFFLLASMGVGSALCHASSLQVQSSSLESCPLHLTVIGASGHPIHLPGGKTPIAELVDPSGRILEAKEVDQDGVADFCDVGFGPHSVVVRTPGYDECFTEINNMRFQWGNTRNLTIMVNFCVGDLPGHVGNACAAHIHVISAATGKSLQAQVTDDKNSPPQESNKYGRIALLIRQNEDRQFVFSKPGYETRNFRMTCPSLNREPEEVTITLPPIDNKR